MSYVIEQLKDTIRFLEEQLNTASNFEERQKLASELTEARNELSRKNFLTE